MHAKSRGSGLRLALAWVLAFAMLASSWPVPALQELVGPATAYAEESDDTPATGNSNETVEAAVEEPAADTAKDTETETPASDNTADTQVEEDKDDAAPAAQESSEEDDLVLTAQASDDDVYGPQVYLDKDEYVLYDDGDLVLTYDDSEIQDADDPSSYSIGVEVGILRPNPGYDYDDDRPECHFDPDYTGEVGDNKAYTFNPSERTITLHGAWLKEHLDQYFEEHPDHDRNDPNERLRVSVWVYHGIDENGNPIQVHPYNPEHGYYDVRAATIDYRPESDRMMVPGDGGYIEAEQSARVENTDYPGGDYVEYEVTNVESSDPSVVSVEYDGYGWSYYAEGHGNATLTVTHTAIDDDEASYTFDVSVGSDRYEVASSIENISSPHSNTSNIGLPGQQMKIRAEGIHVHEGGEDTFDGFEYSWALADGSDALATIEPGEVAEDGSCEAIVTFNELGIDAFFQKDVHVMVTATKNGVSATDTIWLVVSNAYPEVWIAETNDIWPNTAVQVGESQQVTPELRYFYSGAPGDGYTLGKITNLRFDFDSSKVRISYNGTNVEDGQDIPVTNGKVPTFTVTRLSQENFNIYLDVEWEPTEDNGPFALDFADEDGLRYEFADWPFDWRGAGIWFEGDMPDELMVTDANSEVSLKLNTENVKDWATIDWTAGLCIDDDWVEDHIFTEGVEYTVDTETDTITLNGAKVLEHLGGYGDDDNPHRLHVRIFAEAKSPYIADDNPVISNDTHWIDFIEPYEKYEFEEDCEMLPGSGGSIAGSRRVWLVDEDHPEETEEWYNVTDVEVVEGEELLDDFHAESDDEGSWWDYRVKDPGTITFKVTYEKFGGGTDSYTFNVNVVNDLYELDIYVSEGDRWALPGESIMFEAHGVHWYLDEYGQEQREEVGDDDNLRVVWSLVDGGEEYAELENESGTENKVNIKPTDERDFTYEFRVQARMFAGDDEVAADEEWVAAYDSTPTIIPYDADFPFATPVGGTFTIQPKQLWRYLDEEGAIQEDDITDSENVHFDLWFDSECVQVTGEGLEFDEDDDGHVSWDGAKELTFKRLGSWQTNITIYSSWDDGGDERHWWFDEQNYDIWFEDAPDDFIVDSDNNDLELQLNVDNIAVADGLTVEYTVGDADLDEIFTEGEEYSSTYGVVTLHGDEILKHLEEGQDEYCVCVSAVVKSGDEIVNDNECMHFVTFRYAHEDYEFEHDREMLPGWNGSVNRFYRGYVWDANHPDGSRFDYEVTDVQVVECKDSDGNDAEVEDILEFRKDYEDGNDNSDNYWWYYRALDMGTVTLEVTYLDVNYEEQSYTFTINIVGSTYEMTDVWGDEPVDHLFPGGVAHVNVDGWRTYSVKQSDEEGNSWYEQEEDREGLSFVWTVEEMSEGIAEITVDQNDDRKATLTISDLPMGEDLECEAVIRVTMYHDGEEIDHRRWAYTVSTDYIEPSPLVIDQMNVGDEQQVDLELRHYVYGEDDYETVDDVQFLFRYDPDCVEITDGDGVKVESNDDPENEFSYGAGPYTITRKGDWDTDIEVTARCAEYDDYSFAWYLDQLDYNLWFDEDTTDIWVSRDDEGKYTVNEDDATITSTLSLSDDLASVDGMAVDYVMCTGEWNIRGEFFPDRYFTSRDGYYTPRIDDEGRPYIEVNAAKLAEALSDDDYKMVRVWAVAKNGEQKLCESDGDWWICFREREYRYDNIEDIDLLPGWDSSVQGELRVFVRDETYPEGANINCEVSNVEIVSGADFLEDFHRDEDSEGWWWYYRAKSMGTATLKVTYKDPYDQEQSFTFDVNITDSVYSLDVWRDPNTDIEPGGSVELYAEGRLQRYDNYSIRDGFDIRWEIDDSDDYTLTVDPDDPGHATLTFREASASEIEDYRIEVWPKACLYAENDEGEVVEQAINEMCVIARAETGTILPSTIDRNLDAGKSITIDPQVITRNVRNGRVVTTAVQADKVTFYWSFNPENAIKITNASGDIVPNNRWNDSTSPAGDGPFTITRLNDQAVGMRLIARWTDEEGRPRSENMTYVLASKDYHIWFDEETYETCAGSTVTATLDVSRLAGLDEDAYDLDISVGQFRWSQDGPAFGEALDESEFSINKGDTTWTITIPGSALAAHDWNKDGWTTDDIALSAYVDLGDMAGGWGANAPLSFISHKLTHVEAKAATTTATGNTEYWKCDLCGKPFSDEEGTQETTLEDVTIPQLIDIADATVSGVSDKTYDGSAQTQEPVVMMGTTTLTKDTDYTLSYKDNVEPGTATMTIAGKGAYGGTKSVTFKIVPSGPFFLDADPADDANHGAEVEWMGRAGISTGWEVTGGREFRGMRDVTRCDFAAFLYRLADLSDDGERNDSIKLSDARVEEVLRGVSDCTPKGTSHAMEVAWMIDSGISRGWPDKGKTTVSFRPMAKVARQDMAAFLYRFADLRDDGEQNRSLENGPEKVTFSDVRHGDETNHATEVEWLASVGVTKGWGMKDGTYQFRGTRTVARQDMAAFMYRLNGYLNK